MQGKLIKKNPRKRRKSLW